MELPGQRCLFGIFKKGKDEIVDQTCVMKKILRDERNHKVSFFSFFFQFTEHTDVNGRFPYFKLKFLIQ